MYRPNYHRFSTSSQLLTFTMHHQFSTSSQLSTLAMYRLNYHLFSTSSQVFNCSYATPQVPPILDFRHEPNQTQHQSKTRKSRFNTLSFDSASLPGQEGVSSHGRTPHNASKTMTSTWKIQYKEEVSFDNAVPFSVQVSTNQNGDRPPS